MARGTTTREAPTIVARRRGIAPSSRAPQSDLELLDCLESLRSREFPYWWEVPSEWIRPGFSSWQGVSLFFPLANHTVPYRGKPSERFYSVGLDAIVHGGDDLYFAVWKLPDSGAFSDEVPVLVHRGKNLDNARRVAIEEISCQSRKGLLIDLSGDDEEARSYATYREELGEFGRQTIEAAIRYPRPRSQSEGADEIRFDDWLEYV